MSVDSTNNSQGKSGKGPVIAGIVAGILILAGAGGYFVMDQKGMIPGKEASVSDTTAMTDVDAAAVQAAAIEPAAGEAKDTKPANATADGASAIKQGDPVVAKIGGEDVKRSDVFNYIGTLPEQIRQMPLETLFPLALDQVVNNKIIGMKAQQAKLEADPEVTKLTEQAQGQIVRNVYIERELNKAISQKELVKAYQKMLENMGKIEEVHARHILVPMPDEQKAKDIIKKLDEGAKFEDLAKESSDGPTAANGGDLGYFAKNEMVPEFAEAAFALAPGTYTKTPVKTQFGWHVIKVEEKRERPEPQFELVKPQLEAQIRRDELTRLLEKWQKEAKIQKFDINGEAVKAETKKN